MTPEAVRKVIARASRAEGTVLGKARLAIHHPHRRPESVAEPKTGPNVVVETGPSPRLAARRSLRASQRAVVGTTDVLALPGFSTSLEGPAVDPALWIIGSARGQPGSGRSVHPRRQRRRKRGPGADSSAGSRVGTRYRLDNTFWSLRSIGCAAGASDVPIVDEDLVATEPVAPPGGDATDDDESHMRIIGLWPVELAE
jgi:hypothetical protein